MKQLIATMSILLALTVSAQADEGSDEEMRALTSSVLAGLTGGAAPVEAEEEAPSLDTLVQHAVQAGESDAYLKALVNEAVQQGNVAVPEEMVDTEGTIDTATLLASLVAKSDGGADTASLLAEATGDSAEAPAENRIYVVRPGDSLARISLGFCDTTQDYLRIFNANRDQLSSPDRIRVGLKLVIPG